MCSVPEVSPVSSGGKLSLSNCHCKILTINLDVAVLWRNYQANLSWIFSFALFKLPGNTTVAQTWCIVGRGRPERANFGRKLVYPWWRNFRATRTRQFWRHFAVTRTRRFWPKIGVSLVTKFPGDHKAPITTVIGVSWSATRKAKIGVTWYTKFLRPQSANYHRNWCISWWKT